MATERGDPKTALLAGLAMTAAIGFGAYASEGWVRLVLLAGAMFFGACTLYVIALLLGFVGAATDEAPPARGRARTKSSSAAAFDYPVVTVPIDQALAERARLLAEGRGVPVVVGDDDSLARLREAFTADRRTPRQILAAAEKVAFPQALIDADEAFWARPENRDEERLPVGTWPKVAPPVDDSDEGVAALFGARRPARVHIVILPTDDLAEAPAYLKFGGFNACPAPEVHVAALRRWREDHGAELVCCRFDALVLRTRKGPANQARAMELARSVLLYSDWDVNSRAEVAAELKASRVWFFWWD